MKKTMFFVGIIAVALFGCTENNSDNGGTGTTKFNLYLTDAPGKYEEVLIDIQEVKVHVNATDSADESGWIDLDVHAGVYNLLDFTNDMDTLLASAELPAGKISQMRLILGDDNRIKEDGEYHDLKTPSGQQSGIKLNIHAVLEEDITYDLWIDFDACRSIVKAGHSGIYILKPVIKTFSKATSGAISGTVDPVASRPYVMAISSESDTVSTAVTDSISGYFLLKGLPEGSYDVVFEPADTAFQKKTVEDVSVTLGVVTDMGTVEIE